MLNLIFLQHEGKIHRLIKLLTPYTTTTDINTQFIHLLNNPVLIINCSITNIIIEVIYLTHLLYNINLTKYIKLVDLDHLIDYYYCNIKNFILY